MIICENLSRDNGKGFKTLSEKRKELFNEIDNLQFAEYNVVDTRISALTRIKRFIKEQDKEFIKKLKEVFNKSNYSDIINREIDFLAGNKLT